MPLYSICDTQGCPNRGKAANHPRSERDPKHCGICGSRVRMIQTAEEKKEYNVEERFWP